MRTWQSLHAFESGVKPMVVKTKFGWRHRINMPDLEPIVWAGGVLKSLAQVKKIAASIPLSARLPLSLKSVIGLEVVANPLFACVVGLPSPGADENAVVRPR
jgi:hypothetical protein